MATKKIVFIAFAIEDESQRDLLKGQSLNTNSPFEIYRHVSKKPLRQRLEGACSHAHPSLRRCYCPCQRELPQFQWPKMGD